MNQAQEQGMLPGTLSGALLAAESGEVDIECKKVICSDKGGSYLKQVHGHSCWLLWSRRLFFLLCFRLATLKQKCWESKCHLILLILAVLSLKKVLNHDFHWTNAHKYYREKQIVTHQGPLFQYWKESPRKTKCSPELLSCIDSMNTMILSGTISNRIDLCLKATISIHT